MKRSVELSRAFGAAALAAALASSAHSQTLGCTVGVANGGPIPTSGTGGGGTYPTTLPPAALVLPLNVASLPPGATVVTEVKFKGLTHTYTGDVQFVLTAPNGSTHNVFNRPGGSCDYGGDYVVVPECTGGAPFSTCTGVFAPGTYDQFFGTWPSGTNGIHNTALSTIAAATGTWTLTIYDWAGADVGAITTWDVCFGAPPAPSAPTAVPTLSSPANGATFCASSVIFTWTTVACATSYDLDVDGVVTNSSVPSQSRAIATSGPHTWRVRARNASGVSAYSATRAFNTSSITSPWTCVTGGPGGSFPTAGAVDGTWPTVLPTGEFTSNLSVVVPPGATTIKAVRINNLNHTWSGDVQIVLTSPAGVNYNIFQQVDGVFAGGCGDDFAGTYTFVDATGGTDECGAPGIVFTCGLGVVLAPGAYKQYYGAWNSGDAGIVNVNLSAIPVASGTWKLTLYDWYVPADGGTFASWDLCFDTGPAGPVSFCTAGTSSSGCVPVISATAQPSASLASSCVINVANVEGQKSGLIFYGIDNSGFTPLSWGPGSSSFLCVKPPTQRTFAQSSGGTSASCNGSLTQNWNSFQSSFPAALGNPFTVGDKVYAQAWYRDPPAAKTTNLSNALELTHVP